MVLPGRCHQLEFRIDRRGLERHFLEAELCEPAEDSGRQGAAARLDNGDTGGRRESAANGGNAAALHEDVCILQRAGRGNRVHARPTDQQILRGGGHRLQQH